MNVEAALAEFWAEVLEVDAVEPADRLLDLGGNSLAATMVANRIELAWGFRPELADVLDWSLRELADWCEAEAGALRSPA
jgi:acyl carrier protein